MPRIIRDWTKVIIPRTNTNVNPINDATEDLFNTTDAISIRAASEISHLTYQERRRSLTDFALMHQATQSTKSTSFTGKYSGLYWLRSALFLLRASAIQPSGENTNVQVDHFNLGICPTLSLQIPANNDLSEYGEVAEVLSEDGYVEYYTLKIGEYPKTKVSASLNEELESKFNGGHLLDGLTCTGKLYTTNGNIQNPSFASKQNAEFEYNGEKYVRVTAYNDSEDLIYEDNTLVGPPNQVHWVKVEPITFIISNYDEIKRGIATEIELDSEEIILSALPFYPDDFRRNSSFWQNSEIRAFLNSASSNDLDGNAEYQSDIKFDFRNSGFLQQAFNMTRLPLTEYIIPEIETYVCDYAFRSCVGLEKIIIPSHVTKIGKCAFGECANSQIIIPSSNINLVVDENVLDNANFKFIYISKNGESMILSPYEDQNLDKDFINIEYNQKLATKLFNKNYKINYIQLNNLYQNHIIHFIPPDYILRNFPPVHMKNFFTNKNHKRWESVINTLKFNTLPEESKEQALTDLFKIYYVLGGFSEKQEDSKKAYEYLLNHIAVKRNEDTSNESKEPNDIAEELHYRFASLDVNNLYNPMFAKFLMKYYHKNPDFMRFHFINKFDEVIPEIDNSFDYLCVAFNNFNSLQKRYPYHGITGNTNNLLFTPKFVAENALVRNYKNIRPGNEELAQLIGRYGHSQEEFEYIQDIFDDAKLLKDLQTIHAAKASGKNGISFRVLEKDDPQGFIIGHETTCCQCIGDDGESCVVDGYLNPNAGFIVFEQPILDKYGKPTEESRILAQAYLWYDPETKTVCFDNIEIPTSLLETLRVGTKHGRPFSSKNLLDTVIESADAIMTEMNSRGIPVERVTTGKGFNKLKRDLQERFGEPESPPIAIHRGYQGYSDASTAQFVVRTYDETTKHYSAAIKEKSESIMRDLKQIVEHNDMIHNQNKMEGNNGKS